MIRAALFGLIGAILGAATGGEEWALLGLAAGIGVDRFSRVTARFDRIEVGLLELESRLRDLEATSRGARASAPRPAPEAARAEIERPSSPAAPPPESTPAHERERSIAPRKPQAPADLPPSPIEPPPVAPLPGPPPLPRYQADETWAAASGAAVAFFTTGNVVAKVGIIILFFGAAFLVRYAADRGLLPIELRLIALVVGSLALLAVGWRLRQSRPAYATALQGGAIGLLYLTIFAAFRLYELLPALLTFALLLAVVAFSAMLAVLQNEKALAVLGTTGGFLAPILASTGSGDHVGLFSYYLLLNAGIFGIAWFRAWRVLNWVGFVFTFGVGFVWGAQYYQPALFRTTEPFLIVFFLFYLSVAVLFAQRQPPNLRGYVDGSLVFGLPAIAFSMQSVLVRDIPFGRAYSSVALSAVYLLLASALQRKDQLRMLTEAFIALGVVFLTLAVPFAFDGHGTAAAWALEGAGLVWIGVRQRRLIARLAGSALLVVSGFAFELVTTPSVGASPIANSRFLGSVAIAAGGVLAAFHYFRAGELRREWERPFEWILLGWGLLWSAAAVLNEIARFVPARLQTSTILLALSAVAVLAGLAARRLSWPALGHATFGALPIVWIACVGAFLVGPERGPQRFLGWIAWPAAVGASYLLLRLFEQAWRSPMTHAGHVGSAWLLGFLVTWTAAAAVADLVPETPTWGRITWPIAASILLMALVQAGHRIAWPVRQHAALYGRVVPLAPVGFLILWVLWACLQEGEAAPLPYVPLLNPLEIAQGFAVVAACTWWIRARREGHLSSSISTIAVSALAAIAFLSINAVVARLVHFYFDVPFAFEPLMESASFQAGISVLWALTALSLMTLASRRATRVLWLVGAALLGALVMKLFVADLSQVGAIARIVSFLVTGVLILIIGYVAPVPPREQKAST